MLMLAFRSVLFVRADDPELLEAALASEADAVVADLEDQTPPDAKAAARAVVADVFGRAGSGPARLVRVNELGGELAVDDLALVRDLPLDGLVVPQALEDTIHLAEPPGLPVVAVIENARGLRAAYEIAARPYVQAIQLGAKDLSLDLGLESRDDALELLYSRSKIVVDAVAAGLTGIFDRVYPTADPVLLEADALFARSLGFRGKGTVSPGDAAIINRVFAR